MKHFILFIVAILSYLTGFAQGGYDPSSPGDPNPYRKLTVLASPKAGGSANSYDGSQVAVGKSVSCYAYANRYYDFVHWLQNGKIVSTDSHFSFTMPDENVEMTAVFELNYNPESPDDPQEAKPSHRVTLTSVPGMGGYFNSSAFRLCEGDSINVYAYPNNGFRFEEWLLDGILVSTKNPLNIKMTDKDLNYTARFSYNPVSPGDPAVNMFNPSTGEMVIDRFNPGYLSYAINDLLGESYDYSQITSLLISGIMDASDFGFAYNLSDCSVIDLSRTNGYTEIPSYAFSSSTALTELLLPSCINSIGRHAFNGCNNLSVITCLAVMPPSLYYAALDGVDKSVVIKVPAQSIDLYKNAQGWNDFTILPADENVFSILVALPSDAEDGRYKNMSIELLNTSNAQRYRYLITDKTEYTFGNLLSSTTYSVSVKNSKNEILGEISDLKIVDKDISAKFQSLRQPKNITVRVMTPDKNDITSEVTIKWFNDANELLQQGPTLLGVLENSVISYSLTLPLHLQKLYSQPLPQTIKTLDQTVLTYTLDELGTSILKGKVCDADGKGINTAIITISQNINGAYTNSEIAQCDKDGNYEIEVSNVPIKVSISANGYIGQTKDLQTPSTGIGNIVLEKNTGITVYPSYTFQASASTGQETSEWLNDNNIAYLIEYLDGNEIPGCMYQSGSIILPGSITFGDKINVVAYSKNNLFNKVTHTVDINSKSVHVNLPIVGYGGIRITTTDDSDATGICLLYDMAGIQAGKSRFRGNSVLFENLPDGQYTIIAMRKSSLLGSVSNLSSFQETQLVQGNDYLLNNVNVVSGKITDINISNIPDLDETKLYYTNSKETYFMPNKSQLTIGNYVTLKAKLTIKDEYAEDINAATLIVDIPSNCELVDNSIISGSGYIGYEYADNRLAVPVKNLSDAIRFCVIPVEGGDCKSSAFIKMIIDNEEILQPIGTAYFEAKNFTLSAPRKTSKTNIAIQGTAIADSEVLIYDNKTLVGKTYSMPNGQWSTNISLVKPYVYSLHNIHAEIINFSGRHLMTETRIVDYNQSYNDLNTITMAYGKDCFVFDQINGCTNISNYIYWVHPDVSGYQPTPKFTFIADFKNNSPDAISNVMFKVKMLEGTIRYLPGEYNNTLGKWTATSLFLENQAPVNVTADFDISIEQNAYCEEAFNDQINGLINATNHLLEEFENKVSINTSVDETNKFEGYIMYGDYNLPYYVMTLDYDNVYNHLMYEKQFHLYEVNGDKIFYNIESTETKMVYTIVDSNEKLALSITIVTDVAPHNNVKPACNWIGQIRNSRNNRLFLRNLTGAVGTLLDIAGTFEYVNVRGDFNLMVDNAVRYADKFMELDKRTTALILAQCKNGDYRLGRTQMQLADIDRLGLNERTSMFSDKYYQYLSDYKKALEWNIAGYIASFGIGKLIGTTSRFIRENGNIVRWYNKYISSTSNANIVGQTITNSLGIAYNGVTTGLSETIHPAFYDFNGVRDKLWTWSFTEYQEIERDYLELHEKIKRAYHECPEDKEEEPEEKDDNGDDNFPTPPVTPIIDPSGYVYEAVPSNRIPGVTATVYFKQQSEDMYGDITETAVVWDAAPFNQENPLITDAQGMYAWDVPAGMWQVRLEKEGYEPARSEWLPVPPPQLDVNIAMTQVKQPEVKTVHAYSDGVVVEFDKFMLPSTMTLGNITVTQNGQIIDGEIVAANIELDVNGNAFCSKIEYKPTKPFADGEATLFVSKTVKSYASVDMGRDFMQTFPIEPRISEIQTNKNIDVPCGSATTVTASVLPATAAKGKSVSVESLNPMIADVSINQIEADREGNITFDILGMIIGSTGVKLSVDDCDIETIINVNVSSPVSASQVATPSASVEAGEIEAGTEIYLSCDTENASIYYTIDGSCPCDVNRLHYDGTPIIATQDFTLKIMAEADGLDDSEIAEYTYIVLSSGIADIQLDNNLDMFPLPLGEYLNITNGDYTIDSVSIYNLGGHLMLRSNKSEKHVSLKVGFLPSGVYLINIQTDNRTITKKVIKR